MQEANINMEVLRTIQLNIRGLFTVAEAWQPYWNGGLHLESSETVTSDSATIFCVGEASTSSLV